MIHGGFHTGSSWTTTPDGRAGWAPRFAALGWEVYVVDWPRTGRSGGSTPESVSLSAADVVDGLLALLDKVGPVMMVGHSIGAALAFKTAECSPSGVRAIAALTPASVESPVVGWDPAPHDQYVVFTEEMARTLFANGDAFPHHAFANYHSSLVPLAPRIFNSSLGLNEDLKIDSSRDPGWGSRIPVLLLTADQDQLIPDVRAMETSEALGVPLTRLAEDWGMSGHGHNVIVELGTEEIARRVDAWLSGCLDNDPA
ncbi:alpha-beta hydrolase superfamily lysophospholipase [Rhodococcus rhodochrous J45]|uniref:Alpha-beta hydrolase superfamily lysophospholipase n=2 Tax=Rhodococcus rhodochrous TaxID=1829 RepID=A0A562E2Y8_RHORH|nr:alpha-beta hydrolase superfamily lysophospholipase [Rhodococcus rhodochrous J45]